MRQTSFHKIRSAFSLIELMVAMSILSVLLLMMTALLEQVQKSWSVSESRISQFREARVAFDLMAKSIGQASLNTYWDNVFDEDGVIQGYAPTSELHFIVLDKAQSQLPSGKTQSPLGHAIFFQAPLGFSETYRNLNSLFNGRGYLVSYGSDKRFKPSFIQSKDRYRYRLMEFRPPAEANQVWADGDEERSKNGEAEYTQWYKQSMGVSEDREKGDFESYLNPLAENIIAIVLSPRDSLAKAGDSRGSASDEIAPNYFFDSNDKERQTDPKDPFSVHAQQVPPLLRLSMVAISEAAMIRLEGDGGGEPSDISRALSGLFQRVGQYDKDVETLSERLNEKRIDHKIFSTMVMMRSAKWTGK